MELRLEVREFAGLDRWRWVLTGPGGGLLADHEVRLDTGCWQFEAFTDLQAYLDWHVAADQWVEDEARVVADVGEWIGGQVFGPVADAMVAARPATVRVVVPEEPAEARALLFRPLELAHVGGRSLAVQDVTLIMQHAGEEHIPVVPVGRRLRVLGLFSVPEGGQPLNLRRERHALVKLLSRIGAVGRAVEVRVLQYGVTRDRLEEVLEEDEGWDVIHISGHGAPGELLLETAEGSPDPVTASELTGMLDLARERVKLVGVSACWSAALTAADQRRLLGLPEPADAGRERTTRPGRADGDDAAGGRQDGDVAAGALATELVDRLGCAVLAMRYPVVDEFAIALSERLYDLLARAGRPLPRALGMTLASVIASPPTPACPALSAATPALFGARAVDLRLAAPLRFGAQSYDPRVLKMAGFPPQPDRFVGRTGLMARASAALAAESGIPGVVLYGMPGGGKTACALELAYTHEHAFDRLVWFKAPDEGRDITRALTQFAITLENSLPDFKMVGLLEDPARLAAFLPQLTELLEQRRVLVVADNIESLLTSSGQWRDDRWGQVIAAMCAHSGLGRVVLTSRRLPAGLDQRVRVLAVDALPLDEALLLARELPHLRALIDGQLPGVDAAAARSLARGVLNVAQGHPKLLELADGQAASPTSLAALVEAGDQAWQQAGGLPEGFFVTGQPQAAGEDYLEVLATWTRTVTDSLARGERDLFWFLCCLEETDRIRLAVEDNWAHLWARLGRDSTPPDLEAGLAALAAHGLAAIQPGTDPHLVSYGIHPGVAAAGRTHAGSDFQRAVDTELAAYWNTVARYARDNEAEQPTSTLIVHAGLAAAPYLIRLAQWRTACRMLENVMARDQSPATISAILPALQTIAAAVAGTDDEPNAVGVLAAALSVIDPAAAEQQIRTVLDAALARGDYKLASAITNQLVYLLKNTGRLAEALTLAEQQIGYTERAGLGPWSQLSDQAQRLQVLTAMGRFQHVLDEVHRLRTHIDALPADSGQPESINEWNVREVLLNTGGQAALRLNRWQDVLELNAAVAASQEARAAPASQVARTRFNDHAPLIRLGRLDDALAVLLECRRAFEDAGDIDLLGGTLSALASVEYERGHDESAISLDQDALRYSYRRPNPPDIADSHHNLGNHLSPRAHRPAEALTHHLAAALLLLITGGGSLEGSVRAAADDLRALGQDAAMPADVAELCRQIAEVPGVELARLLMALTSPEVAEQAYRELAARVRAAAAPSPARP